MPERFNNKNKRQTERSLRMMDSIHFQEMVFTTIASDFELWSKPDYSSSFFSPRNRFLNIFHIAIKIHSPLIQITRHHFYQSHLFIVCLTFCQFSSFLALSTQILVHTPKDTANYLFQLMPVNNSIQPFNNLLGFTFFEDPSMQ